MTELDVNEKLVAECELLGETMVFQKLRPYTYNVAKSTMMNLRLAPDVIGE